MMIGRIHNATRVMGAPKGTEESCGALAIKDQPTPHGNMMTSAWYPTPDELKAMQMGAPIYLHIWGTSHPMVALSMGENPL